MRRLEGLSFTHEVDAPNIIIAPSIPTSEKEFEMVLREDRGHDAVVTAIAPKENNSRTIKKCVYPPPIAYLLGHAEATLGELSQALASLVEETQPPLLSATGR